MSEVTSRPFVGDRPGDRARDLLGVRPVDPERQHERGGCEAQEPSGRHQALLLKSFPGTDRRKRPKPSAIATEWTNHSRLPLIPYGTDSILKAVSRPLLTCQYRKCIV